MYIQALIWFLVAWLTVTPAYAGPLIAAIAAFASTAIGGIIVNAALGIALSIGSSLLSSLFKKPGRDPGTAVQLRVGGANPLIFPLGESSTAGVRVYYGTWQESNRTPNEFVVDVIAVSAIPVPGGVVEYWLNDQKVTLDTSGTKPAQGWPVIEFRKDGRDHAWLDFHDGTQTTVNPYLVSKFGGHPNYPWQNDMIGRGVAYVTLTCRYNKDGLWQSGFPNLLVGLSSIPLYDPRLDSTNGGSGPHRWGEFDTYEPSNNAMVRAYNIARGIYFEDEWVYGGQNWPAMRLPVSSWMAGMNACDLLVDGDPQFHGGGIVECDIEIAKTLEELLRSASGLIAEVGGSYKIRIGAPGAPVMSFNDSNIVVTREQGYDPFPGLEDTYNIVRILYTEKEERWSTKESPERRDEAAIISDDNREFPMQVTLPWVTDNITAQRIGKTALENGRRFRRHSMYQAPLFWLIEPLDVVAWTSAHNQYTAKEFDIEQISGSSSMMQAIVIRENDPSDYNWNPLEDLLPYEIIPIVPIITPSQPVTGWQVFPAIIYDDVGRERRPSIEVRFDGNLTDISNVRIQVRLATGGAAFWDNTIPYPAEPVSIASTILNGDFPPNVTCEVRAKFVPISDRDTSWTAWLPVTTPNVRLVPGEDFDPYEGVIDFENLEPSIREWQDWVGRGVREIQRRFEEFEIWTSDQDLGNEYDRQQIRQQLTATYENARAEWKYDVDVVAAENFALSQRVETLNSELINQAGQIAANSSAVNVLQTQVTAQGNEITALSTSLTNLESTVTTQGGQISGNSSAISGLQTQVTTNGNNISSLSSSLTSLESTVTNQAGQIAANASAVSALETEVSVIDGRVTEQAQAITALSAGTGSNVNTANFRMQVVSGPSGYSRIGAQTRQGGAGSWRGASWFLDTPNNAALPTRFVVSADQFIVASDTGTSATLTNPLVFSGGVLRLGGGIRANWAQIENVDIAWADIENAVVNNFVATSANIGFAVIEDGMIAAGAITNSDDDTYSGNLPTPDPNVSVWYNSASAAVSSPSLNPITVGYFINSRKTSTTPAGASVRARILHNGTPVPGMFWSHAITASSGDAFVQESGVFLIVPTGTGPQTVTIQVNSSSAGIPNLATNVVNNQVILTCNKK